MKINERLGVPNGINDEAKRIYQILLKELDSIQIPDFKGGDNIIQLFNFDLKFADLEMKDIPFLILIEYFPGVDAKPELVSAAYGSTSTPFHRNKTIRLQSEFERAHFHLKIACGETLTKEDISDAINKKVTTSMMAHELMHLYDHFKKGSSGIKSTVQYASYQSVHLPGSLSRLLFLLYFTSDIENTVRPTEVYQSILDSGISKEGFLKFLEESDVIRLLKEAKNFSLDDFKKKLESDEEVIKLVKEATSTGYDSIGSVSDDALNLLFINLVNQSFKITDEIIRLYLNKSQKENPLNRIRQLFGLDSPDESTQIAQENFDRIVKGYIKYQRHPQKYFEVIEKKLNFVGDKMIKKLAKLYDMTPDTKTQESIVNWDLHQEILKKNGKPLHITINFDKFKP